MSSFVYKIGADISEFTKSISEVEDELDRLKNSLKSATGQGIIETNLKIKELQQSLVNLKNVGLDKLPKSTADASFALNTLSGVTRDLPFGFIAIQNNLPLVVDSFGQLTKQAGGLGPALKSIGASLIGPAGLSFAFGAVVAGVTALIQKYGSLGEAFNAILGLAPKITETQKEYNKAVAETTGNVALEEAKIKILTTTLTDLTQPQEKRIDAYNELKKVSPDIVAGIKEENALTSSGIELIKKSTEARLQLLKLKIQEAGITAVLTKNAELLATKQQELNLASKEYVSASAELTKAQNQSNVTGLAQVQIQQAAFSNFKSAASDVSSLQKEIANLNAEQDSYLKQLQPIVTQTAAINSATKERTDNLKDQIKSEKELSKTLDQQRKEGWQGIIDALKEVDVLAKETLQSNQRVAAVNAKLLQDKAALNKAKALKEQAKATKEAENAALSLAIAEGEQQFQATAPNALAGFKDLVPKLIQETNAAAGLELFKNSFTNPLGELFSNFLDTGKLSFQEFGKTILQTINQIVGKIIATGIINLLGSILFPGAPGVTKGVGGAFKAAFGSILGLNLGGKVAAPSFAGVGGGQLGMSGQVNVVLRGQDLVGALNRTNSTINRVG
jgi:hypothetical protein